MDFDKSKFSHFHILFSCQKIMPNLQLIHTSKDSLTVDTKQNENLAYCSVFAVLVFSGLWSLCFTHLQSSHSNTEIIFAKDKIIKILSIDVVELTVECIVDIHFRYRNDRFCCYGHTIFSSYCFAPAAIIPMFIVWDLKWRSPFYSLFVVRIVILLLFGWPVVVSVQCALIALTMSAHWVHHFLCKKEIKWEP